MIFSAIATVLSAHLSKAAAFIYLPFKPDTRLAAIRLKLINIGPRHGWETVCGTHVASDLDSDIDAV